MSAYLQFGHRTGMGFLDISSISDAGSGFDWGTFFADIGQGVVAAAPAVTAATQQYGQQQKMPSPGYSTQPGGQSIVAYSPAGAPAGTNWWMLLAIALGLIAVAKK